MGDCLSQYKSCKLPAFRDIFQMHKNYLTKAGKLMDITKLTGIGAKRAEALRAAGLHTVYDLINYFPRDYDDRSQIKTVEELIPGAVNTIRGTLTAEPENVNPAGKFGRTPAKRPAARPLTLTKAVLKDATGYLELVWFNQPYLKKYFRVGQEYIFTGRVRLDFKNRLQMDSPDYEPCGETQLSGGRIVPVYTTPKGFSQKTFRALIFQALGLCAKCEKNGDIAENKFASSKKNTGKHNSSLRVFDDNLPVVIRQEYQLRDRKAALFNIHFPESDQIFMAARRRLVFEELFFMQMALFALKSATAQEPGIVPANTDYTPFLKGLPFVPTGAQERVLDEIKTDYNSGVRMNRLIQGDVGSGKTAVAMAAAYLAIKNGYQAAIMAPTDVLAQQHFADFSRLLAPHGIETVLLTGSLTAKARREALVQIAGGRAGMIVGTHALIQSGVEFGRLGLVITDEQHRFGVNQRFQLSEKGQRRLPHTLVMTATPIPRTLALILYGDLDISIIDELPPGRQKIKTYCVDSRYRERVHGFIRKEAEAGRQAYIICPAIEEGRDLDESSPSNAHEAIFPMDIRHAPGLADGTNPLESGEKGMTGVASPPICNVLAYTKELSAALPGFKITCLHGRMKPAEKQEIMDRFKAGKLHALVSTTVIEVGVHVANATLMIIENAERFGLSQLHQLRGRVGRGATQSYCILLTDTKNQLTKARMKAMTETTDGFKLAELDLAQRGSGDFFGTRQHGLPDFTIANLYRDMDILKIAQSAAHAVHRGQIALSEEEAGLVAGRVGLVPIL